MQPHESHGKGRESINEKELVALIFAACSGKEEGDQNSDGIVQEWKAGVLHAQSLVAQLAGPGCHKQALD